MDSRHGPVCLNIVSFKHLEILVMKQFEHSTPGGLKLLKVLFSFIWTIFSFIRVSQNLIHELNYSKECFANKKKTNILGKITIYLARLKLLLDV